MASQDENANENQQSKGGLSIRFQKNIMGKMSSKKLAKAFIDDISGQVLDRLHSIAQERSGKKDADKVLKNAIKIAVKLGILSRNKQLNYEDINRLQTIRSKFKTLCMTIISFHEVEFSYDYKYIFDSLNEISEKLIEVVSHHLTEKSIGRVNYVFQYFTDETFLNNIFNCNSIYKPLLNALVLDLNRLLELNGL